jgi:hypothetical protein
MEFEQYHAFYPASCELCFPLQSLDDSKTVHGTESSSYFPYKLAVLGKLESFITLGYIRLHLNILYNISTCFEAFLHPDFILGFLQCLPIYTAIRIHAKCREVGK